MIYRMPMMFGRADFALPSSRGRGNLVAMERFFWIVAALGLGTLIGSRFVDVSALQKIWDGPEGAIVARGLPPQIELITKAAEASGWAAKCEAKDGELTLVEFTPTFRAHFSSGQAAYERISVFATSSEYLDYPSVKGEECGSGPSGMSKGVGQSTLGEVLVGYGPPAELEYFFEVANRCELRELTMRPLTSSEIEWLGDEVPEDWEGLVLQPTEANQNQAHCWSVIASQDELSEIFD